MAYVNTKDMITKAKNEGYAVPQFNINNLEWTKVVLEECQKANSPVMLGVSAGAAKHMGGWLVVTEMTKAMITDMNITVPVALHLDHGTAENCEQALAAGFSSIMYDGSHFDIDTNIAETTKWVEKAHAKGATIEAEIGAIGGEEDGVEGNGEIADPKHAKLMMATGIDMLAAGIGNIHGKYPEGWKGLNFDVLNGVNGATGNLPLVLHGGSGIPEDQIKKAIKFGVAKINVNTELQLRWFDGLNEYFTSGKVHEKKNYDPRKVMMSGMDNMRKELQAKIEMFGSKDKG